MRINNIYEGKVGEGRGGGADRAQEKFTRIGSGSSTRCCTTTRERESIRERESKRESVYTHIYVSSHGVMRGRAMAYQLFSRSLRR